jgi:hypothetical protein
MLRLASQLILWLVRLKKRELLAVLVFLHLYLEEVALLLLLLVC